jgi:hypothetical protein
MHFNFNFNFFKGLLHCALMCTAALAALLRS